MRPHGWGGGSSLSHPAGLGPAGVGVLEGHSGQGDALAEAGMGRLICMQGPPRREPPPLPLLRGFEQKLRFPSVLVSLSRSEPERGQEQSARPPFNLPAPAGRSRRRGPREGRAGQLHGLAPGEAGMGSQAQLPSCPWGPLPGGDHCGCPGGSVPFQSAWPFWSPDQPSGGQLRSGVMESRVRCQAHSGDRGQS